VRFGSSPDGGPVGVDGLGGLDGGPDDRAGIGQAEVGGHLAVGQLQDADMTFGLELA
jgi:hypothetical protein